MIASKFDAEYVGHDGYNKFIQTVQREAEAWGFKTRVRQDGFRSYFELFYDGDWRMLGSEIPFSPDDASRDAMTFSRLWDEIQYCSVSGCL